MAHTGGLVNGLLSLAGSLFDLALFAFTRPAVHGAERIGYWQEGCYFYSATGSQPARSGEIVSMEQTHFLDIGFMYKLLGMQIQGVTGSREMTARIVNEQSGWQHTLALTPRSAFSGDACFTLSTLDLAQVEAIIADTENQTEMRGGTCRVEIVTHIRFNGLALGRYIMDDFEPALVFRYDKARLLPLDAKGKRVIPMRFTKPGPLADPVPAWEPSLIFQTNPSQWEGGWRWAE